MKSHYEQLTDLWSPNLGVARKYAKEYGWRGFLQYLRDTQRWVAERGADRATQDFTSTTGEAIIFELVRRATAAKPFSLQHAADDPDTTMFFAWFRQHIIDNPIGEFGTDESIVNSNIAVQRNVHWQVACFEIAGKKTYEVSEGLAERLLDTELRGLHCEDVRLPYRTIYLCVPPKTGLKVANEMGIPHPCEGVYVTEDLDGETDRPGRAWRFCFVGSSLIRERPWQTALFTFSIHLPEGQLLSTALDAEDAAIRARHPEATYWRPLFEFVLNTTIYATWPDAASEHLILNKEARQLWDRAQKAPRGSRKRAELHQRYRAAHPQERIYLGRGIEPWTDEQKHEHRPGKPLLIRTKVQGHWRNQAYGPKWTMHRVKWIEPFWRGPETGAEPEKHHVLG